jgi:hypothetical protein
MALVARYDTPAGLRDVPEDSSFYDAWHEFVNGKVSDSPGSPWIDPVLVDADVVTVRTLSWIGFPRATLTVDRRDDRAQAFADAEEPGATPKWRPRQFEYFEWYTTRDATGRVTKVAFSTETPQYFELLAAVDKERVVELYRGHVDPAVRWDELVTADGTYDRHNRWTTIDGMMHYVNGINELNQAIGLAQDGARATFADLGDPGLPPARDNFEFPVIDRNAADDYIIREVAALGRSGFDITVHDPVGLYIDGWNDTGWTKPDGSPVGDYWRITRGRPGAVLRLEYEVPYEEGFVVGDILIGGRSVLHGGQLAEHMTSSLQAVVARRSS